MDDSGDGVVPQNLRTMATYEMGTHPRSTDRIPDRVLLVSIWLITVGMTASKMVIPDPDLWGHVWYGMEDLRRGSITPADPYSYTAPQAEWINHEWLTEWCFGFLWLQAGAAGLWALRLVFSALILGLVLKIIYETAKGPWSGLFVFAAGWFDMDKGLTIRPQLFTYALFVLLIFLIHRIYQYRRSSVWYSLLFVPLMCLWANLHGGFLVGVGLLSFLLFHQSVEWVRGRVCFDRLAVTAACTSLALIATGVNPYGFRLWTWLWTTLRIPIAARISEWSSVFAYPFQTTLVGYYILVGLALVAIVSVRGRGSWFEWVLLLVVGVVSAMQVRHTLFFCVIAAVYVPKYLEVVLPFLAAPSTFRRPFLIGAPICSLAFAIGIHSTEGRRPGAIWVDMRDQPYNAVRFIHENDLSGNLLLHFNWAQMAIWYLHDRCKVAFDGRFRTVYPPVIEDAYFEFHRMGGKWSELLDNYDTHMVLMPANWIGTSRMNAQHDWRLVYESTRSSPGILGSSACEHAVLFVRRGRFPDFERRVDGGQVVLPGARGQFRFGQPLARR